MYVGVRQSCVRPAIGVLVTDTVSSPSPYESEKGPAAVRGPASCSSASNESEVEVAASTLVWP